MKYAIVILLCLGSSLFAQEYSEYEKEKIDLCFAEDSSHVDDYSEYFLTDCILKGRGGKDHVTYAYKVAEKVWRKVSKQQGGYGIRLYYSTAKNEIRLFYGERNFGTWRSNSSIDKCDLGESITVYADYVAKKEIVSQLAHKCLNLDASYTKCEVVEIRITLCADSRGREWLEYHILRKEKLSSDHKVVYHDAWIQLKKRIDVPEGMVWKIKGGYVWLPVYFNKEDIEHFLSSGQRMTFALCINEKPE